MNEVNKMSDIKFKRSLIGYSPSCVMEKIRMMNLEFEKELNKLENDLLLVTHETESITEKIQILKSDIAAFEKLENNISRSLMQTYIQNSDEILHAEITAEQMKSGMQKSVIDHENERSRLKKVLKQLTEELQCKINEYRQKLVSFDFEEEGDTDEKKVNRL